MIQYMGQNIFHLYMQGLKSIQNLLYIQGDSLAIFLYNWVSMSKLQDSQLLDRQSRGHTVTERMDFLLGLRRLALKFDYARISCSVKS